MNQDKKLRLLLAPMIFVILLFVPLMLIDIIPNAYKQGILTGLYYPGYMILCTTWVIWFILFYHIPIGVYIAMLVIYTSVAWTWILRQKKGKVVYFLVWLVLGVLSILMYWKWGELFHIMATQ